MVAYVNVLEIHGSGQMCKIDPASISVKQILAQYQKWNVWEQVFGQARDMLTCGIRDIVMGADPLE